MSQHLFSPWFFLSDTISIKPVKVYWGWSYTVPEKSPLLYLVVLYLLGISLYTLYVCFHYYLTTTNCIKKRQSVFVFLGVFTPFVVFIITDFIVNVDYPVIPEFTSFSLIIECGLIGYAIWKYELFEITLTSAVDKVLTTMSDALILIDSEERISALNQAALNLLAYEEGEIVGRPVTDVFEEQDTHAFLHKLYHENPEKISSITDIETTFKPKIGSTFPVSLSVSALTDNKGRHVGVVFVGRDIANRKLLEDELIKARVYCNIPARYNRAKTGGGGTARERTEIQRTGRVVTAINF